MKIEELKVETVDTEKLIKLLKIKLPENQELKISDFAILNGQIILDSDCCFSILEDFHYKGKIQTVVQLSCRIKTHNPNGTYSISMFTGFYKIVTLKAILKISKEVNLTDFIRYNYNPRIQGNQRLLMKTIKEIEE